MTEQEWLACETPEDLYACLCPIPDRRPGWSDRKDRLLGCACARRMSAHLTPDDLWCLDALESYADGTVSDITLDHVRETNLRSERASSSARMNALHTVGFLTTKYVSHLGDFLSDVPSHTAGGRCATGQEYSAHFDDYLVEERRAVAVLAREIAGNPFRPVALDPAWLTSDVVALATGIYSDRAFDRMPILADALQDAGCDNTEILNHCRGETVHVRGCWVVDLLLGKT